MTRTKLGNFEYQILKVILCLGNEAYGVPIHEELEKRTGRTIAIGALYTTLQRLDRKGFVSSRKGEPTPERGGRAKKFYRVEPLGQETVGRYEAEFIQWQELVPSGGI